MRGNLSAVYRYGQFRGFAKGQIGVTGTAVPGSGPRRSISFVKGQIGFPQSKEREVPHLARLTLIKYPFLKGEDSAVHSSQKNNRNQNVVLTDLQGNNPAHPARPAALTRTVIYRPPLFRITFRFVPYFHIQGIVSC